MCSKFHTYFYVEIVPINVVYILQEKHFLGKVPWGSLLLTTLHWLQDQTRRLFSSVHLSVVARCHSQVKVTQFAVEHTVIKN